MSSFSIIKQLLSLYKVNINLSTLERNVLSWVKTHQESNYPHVDSIQLITFHKVDTDLSNLRKWCSLKPMAEVNITSKGLITQCPSKWKVINCFIKWHVLKCNFGVKIVFYLFSRHFPYSLVAQLINTMEFLHLFRTKAFKLLHHQL